MIIIIIINFVKHNLLQCQVFAQTSETVLTQNCDYSNVQESMNNKYIYYIIQTYTNIFHSLSPCEYRTSGSHCQTFSLDHPPKKQSWQPRNSVNRLKRHKVMLTKINRFSIINTTAHIVQRIMKVWLGRNKKNKEKRQDEAQEMYFLTNLFSTDEQHCGCDWLYK